MSSSQTISVKLTETTKTANTGASLNSNGEIVQTQFISVKLPNYLITVKEG